MHYIHVLLLFSWEVLSDSFATPWTIAYQALLSMGFPRHFPLQGIFPTQGLNPCLLYGHWVLYHWTTRETRVDVCPRTVVKCHVNVFLEGIQAGQCASVLRSHRGPTSTPSPKWLMGFLPNGHFFSKTLFIYFKLISSLAFFPIPTPISSSL